MNQRPKAFLVAVSALGAAGAVAFAATLPLEEQWLGFPFTITTASVDPNKQPTDLTAPVFFNFFAPEPKGTVDLPQQDKDPEKFNYDFAFPVFVIKRLADEGGAALYETTATPIRVYEGLSPNAAKNLDVRVVVKNASQVVPYKNFELVVPAGTTADKYIATDEAKKKLRDLTMAALKAKTLKDMSNPPLTAGQTVAIRPAGSTPPGPVSDPLADAVAALLAAKDFADKTEAALAYATLKGADGAPDADKARLLALRQRMIADGQAAANGRKDDRKSANDWRKDTYVQQTIGNHVVTPNPAIQAVLQARGVGDNDVLKYFCPNIPLNPGGAGADSAFGQAQAIATTGSWDKTLPSVQSKCQAYYAGNNTSDPRVPDRTGGGDNNNNTNVTNNVVGPTTGDGKFHVPPEDPAAAKPPTNPLKNYIWGAKTGLLFGMLGFIFGGPAGALLLGAMGAGLGYWMTKYK